MGWVKFMIALLIINFIVGGFATKYIIDFWGTYVGRGRVDVPLLPCMIAGIFFGEVTIPGAIGTFIMSLFLDNPGY